VIKGEKKKIVFKKSKKEPVAPAPQAFKPAEAAPAPAEAPAAPAEEAPKAE